jgi:hypothetical protein
MSKSMSSQLLCWINVSQLRDYRFLVVEEQIVIVEPRDHSIALVIDRT